MGRPATGATVSPMSISFSDKHLMALDKAAKDLKMNRSKLIRRLIEGLPQYEKITA